LIDYLARLDEMPPDRPEMAGPDHPIRKMTREIAFEPGAWTPERKTKVAELFDTMAPEWNKRTSAERQEPLRDALARSGTLPDGLCVEIGSGTGASTPDLADRFEAVVALDLSREMLRHAPAQPGHRVQGDASMLPLADGSAACMVLVNALLFPTEMNRVLRAPGTLLWVSSLGEFTPIYLAANDVEKALPGEWSGVAGEAGWGSWVALRRARPET
jgi:SAM-dependent methyltransferase